MLLQYPGHERKISLMKKNEHKIIAEKKEKSRKIKSGIIKKKGEFKEKKRQTKEKAFAAESAAVERLEVKLGRKTTIKARIVRLAFISVCVSTVVLTVFNLVSMNKQVVSSSTDEVQMLSIAYASAISNADLENSKNLLAEMFKDFEETNRYNGYGFVFTSAGGIISETSCDFLKRGDNIVTLAETDTGYAELKAIIDGFDVYADGDHVYLGQRVVIINGSRYLVGWAPIENYENCYTMIILPYLTVMKPYYIAKVAAILMAAAFITASIIISTNVAKLITKPITDASLRLQALSKGDLESPSPVTRRNDETLILLNSLSDTISSLNSYINDIKSVLSGVAEGNLLVRSDAEYSGDFEAIKESLEKILISLNGTFGEVHKAALSVKECSAHVSDGTAVLSKNTSVEASTMEELTASIADVSEKINNNASEAEQAREITVSADKVAEQGSRNMRQMIEAIGDIETSASEIEKIINVIDDIAFQTNILALNAAVEAARAGAAGKGFAVVADEVRNLATKSAEAAAQTGRLIENSIESVRRGTRLADETAKSLDKVVEMVGAVSTIVDNIAVSAGEQADSVSQINKGMEMINGSIQDNSITAEQNASVSEELSGQFDVLNKLINKFKFHN